MDVYLQFVKHVLQIVALECYEKNFSRKIKACIPLCFLHYAFQCSFSVKEGLWSSRQKNGGIKIKIGC